MEDTAFATEVERRIAAESENSKLREEVVRKGVAVMTLNEEVIRLQSQIMELDMPEVTDESRQVSFLRRHPPLKFAPAHGL